MIISYISTPKKLSFKTTKLNTKKHFVLSLLMATFFTLLNHIAIGQVKYLKGYIITLSGDTVHGEIRKNFKMEAENFRKVRHRVKKGMKLSSYTPVKIKGYKIENDIFVSRSFEDEDVFLKQLLTGSYNLYEAQVEIMQSTGIVLEKSYLIEKSSDKILVEVQNRKFKKQMIPLLIDNKDIVAKLEEKEYTYKNTIDMITIYNQSKTNN